MATFVASVGWRPERWNQPKDIDFDSGPCCQSRFAILFELLSCPSVGLYKSNIPTTPFGATNGRDATLIYQSRSSTYPVKCDSCRQ